jgi:hypothetical protein
MSSNSTQGFGYNQPGSTTSAILGNSTGRITTKINDLSIMQRWSGIKLNTIGKQHINIITVHQSTKSDGISTNYMQQVSTLKEQG